MRPLRAAVPPFGGRATLFVGFLAAALVASCTAPREQRRSGVLSEAGPEEDGLCLEDRPAEEARKSLIQQGRRHLIAVADEEEEDLPADAPPRRAQALLQARSVHEQRVNTTEAELGEELSSTGAHRRQHAGLAVASRAARVAGTAAAAAAATASGRGAANTTANPGLGGAVGSQDLDGSSSRRSRATPMDRWIEGARQKVLAAWALIGLVQVELTGSASPGSPAVQPPKAGGATPPPDGGGRLANASASGSGEGGIAPAGAGEQPMSLASTWAREGRRQLLAAQEKLASLSGEGSAVPWIIAVFVAPVLIVTCCFILAGMRPRNAGDSSTGFLPFRPPPRPMSPTIGSARTPIGGNAAPSSIKGMPMPADPRRRVSDVGRPSFPSVFGGNNTAPASAPQSARTPDAWYGESWRSSPLAELRVNPLCPSLLVPEGCECTLLMPRLAPGFFSDGRQLAISDPRGSPVMRVAFCVPTRTSLPLMPSAKGSSNEGSRLVLSDMADEVLAFCQDDKAKTAGAKVVISINSPEGMFATFQQSGNGTYEVTGRRAWKLNVMRRSVPGGTGLALLDESGQLLAVCEPSDEDRSARSVRIDANVDAGLVILCLLCSDVVDMV